MIRILVAEDEAAIARLISANLEMQGYKVECAYDGKQAADMLEQKIYDLVLLDIMLPVYDGYELLEFIKPDNIPAIFITAKGSVNDRVKGLKAGADDYIVKPFEIVELIARVESVLRRYNKASKAIEVDDVVINLESHSVTKNGRNIVLTVKEFDLLVMLVQNKNTALFRETLYERVWGTSFIGETRTLDSHIQHLRKKLGWENKIKTIYKVGYRLEV